MPAISSPRRCTLPPTSPFVVQRLPAFPFSTASSFSPLINPSNYESDPHKNSSFGSFLKWVSGITMGCTLGLLCRFHTSASDSSSLSKSTFFSDSSTETVETGRRSRSLFRKLSLPETHDILLFGDAFRRRIFFNYEKRIRLLSPPEKVFEYFASYRTPEGELLMRPVDLMRAVVPVFPPSESNLVREGYLIGERHPGELRCYPSEFFMLFDVNNDGLISFKEYIFFVTLLSIPESSFSMAFKMFDIDNNGEIDKEEFRKVMALMRSHNRQGAYHKGGLRTGFNVHGSVENGGLVEKFFGKDGNGYLQHDKFVEFLRDLHSEILRLEFDHYDYKSRGTISAKDFALSVVASADMSQLSRLIDRVDKLNKEPHFKDARITFEEFKNFAELRKKLVPFSLALFGFGKVNGFLTRDDFKRAASQVCGVSLSDNVVNIIFHVFDSNCDGSLSSEEFLRVVHKRERDIAQPVGDGVLGFLSCSWNHVKNRPIPRLHS